MERTVLLVLNGKSASRADVRDAVARIRQEGTNVDVRVTWESGDAKRLAVEAANQDNCIVIAGGGDGTVNEVVNGLFSSGEPKAALGILPLGTANDFASSAALPIGDCYRALSVALSAKPVRIDIGKVNERYFINVASGGFGAEVTAETPLVLKKALGGTAYGLAAIVMAARAKPYIGRIIAEGQSRDSVAITMIAIGNARQAGGGAMMTPFARINDGMLDVMVVPAHESNRFAHLLADLIELREHGGEHYRYFRVNQVRIESEDELQFNLDGEPVRGKEFDFSILPSSLFFAAPFGSPLLSDAK